MPPNNNIRVNRRYVDVSSDRGRRELFDLVNDSNTVQPNVQAMMDLIRAFRESVHVTELNVPQGAPQVRAQRNRRPRNNHVRRITRRTFEQNPIAIREHLAEINSNAILFDGLDAALIGISEQDGLAVYERNLIIGLLERRDGMSYEEAQEFYEYNIAGVRTQGAPVIVDLGWTGEEDSASETVDGEESQSGKKKKKKAQKKDEERSASADPIGQLEL